MRAVGDRPAILSYNGGKFPLTTFLADRVRHMIHDPKQWEGLPGPVREWFEVQRLRSGNSAAGSHLLVETFSRGDRHYLVTASDGWLAHQTLGMLLTRRLERIGAKPTGFVASEYAMAVWGMEDLGDVDMNARCSIRTCWATICAWLDESALDETHLCAMRADFRPHPPQPSGQGEKLTPGEFFHGSHL
ncbi:MAG: hypothetical protein R3B98_04775 [Hyphomonas sp.]